MVEHALMWDDARRVVSRPSGPVAALALLVSDQRELDILVGIEGLTNPLAREAAGILATIPPARRYVGPKSDLVMTPFVLPRESRFSDSSYGVLYAADTIDTALRESGHHQALRLAATAAPAGTTVPMFAFSIRINTTVIDVRSPAQEDSAIYDHDSYIASQTLGRNVRKAGHNGLLYNSVRNTGGECAALFWPDAVKGACSDHEWRYYFDGKQISEYAQVA